MKKRYVSFLVTSLCLGVAILAIIPPPAVQAQIEEPEVVPAPEPQSPYTEGNKNSIGVNVELNNFGIKLAGQYTRYVGPMTELTLSAGITGLRDASEQNFQDFFTGQQIVPNKYNRALGFPFMIGFKQRLFAHKIDDSFRFFVSAEGGPALAFIYPYFNDVNGNGYRDFYGTAEAFRVEPINDFFTGWGEGFSQWGMAGEIKLGIDIGENFSKLTTVEFGYFFYQFNQGIQMLEPYRPEGYNEQGFPVGQEPFFDAQKHFGTPAISFVFGGLW